MSKSNSAKLTLMTLVETQVRARERLAPVGETAHLDAEVLLRHACELDRAALIARRREPLEPETAARFWRLIERRAAGEPVAYITGEREFWSLCFRVTPEVLIPRPETELLIEQTLRTVPPDAPARIADLGTGSGIIGIALAHERPRARIVALDICAKALAVARANATRHGLSNIEFRQGSWFEPLADEVFDVIVSNPPYIAEADNHLERGDVRFEPRQALVAGRDGLDAIGHIAEHARNHLRPGGHLLFEHGSDQADAVAALLRDYGYLDIYCHRDLAGQPRVTACRTPARPTEA